MTDKPKFLVIRQLALGDVLLTTPIIRQLFIDHQGQCEIDLLTMKPEVFNHNPYIHRVFTPNTFEEIKGPYTRIINLDLAYENKPGMHIIDAYATVSHGSCDEIEDKQPELFSSHADRQRAVSIQQQIIAGPYLVVHMRKDTWPSRNLPDQIWKKISDLLLEHTELKIVQVGSSHEIAFDDHPRLINLLGQLNLQELYEIIQGAQCYLGIDSGTLHVAACTQTPIIAMFTSAHHRLRAPLGRAANAPFIPITPKLDCYGCQEHYSPPITGVICHRGDPYAPPCRDAFDLNDIRDALTKILIAAKPAPMPQTIPARGPKILSKAISGYDKFWDYFETFAAPLLQHRAASFRMAFEHLSKLQRPVCIVETGCVRNLGTFTGEGQSTVLFDKFSEMIPGTVVHSVDISPENTRTCKSIVSDRVTVHTSDSVSFLRGQCAKIIEPYDSIDLLYLDSHDVDMHNPHDSALHHLKELLAAAKLLRTDTLILVNDSPTNASFILDSQIKLVTSQKVGGKAKYIAEYMESTGARPLYHGYQAAWLGL